MDTTPWKTPDFVKLRVDLQYNQKSPELIQLRAVVIRQVLYSHTKDQGWTWEVV